MSMMWLGGLADHSLQESSAASAAQQQVHGVARSVKDLEHHVARLSLLNQALWELVRGKLGVTDADLERLASEIDLRDGVQDGCITSGPLQCPRCQRVSNSKHWKCLYCGLEFEKPVMG
jgi:hypothetical protein